MADQTNTDAPVDEGPAPWTLAWKDVANKVGNVVQDGVDKVSAVANGALNQMPWEMDATQLSQQLGNKRDLDNVSTPNYPQTVQPSNLSTDGIFQRLVGTESGGKHTNADGSLLTSDKGAQGITQVLPKTGDNPGYGVTPLQNNSKDEYLRFGRDYLNAMIKNFQGDTTKAVAAYNAGAGTVEKLVDKLGPNWQVGLPNETKKYVKKILGA